MALLAVATALALKLLVDPWLAPTSPFLFFTSAVMFAAWFGGFLPGVVATAAAALITDYLFLDPRYSLLIAERTQALPLAIFCLEGTFISALGESLRAAIRRGERAQRESARREEALRDSERRYHDMADTARASEQRLRRLIDANLIGVVSWRESGEVTDANDRFLALAGYPRAELVRLRWPELVAREYLPLHTAALERIKATGACEPFDSRLVRSDGVEVPIFCGGVSFDASGRDGVTFVIDMSESKRTECELKAANHAKDELLAMLSHELRNPLSAVRNAVLTARLDDTRRDRALEVAGRQVEQLERLVDGLLDVARITQGKITLRRDRVSVADVVERAVESVRSMVGERGHALSVRLPEEKVWIEGDSTRLEQAVVNLLTNAAKYTPSGGRIEVAAEREGGDAVVRVRDNGVGIGPEMLARVFDLFAQADRSLDRAPGGLGIGLTLVRRLVEMHGGRVAAHSDGVGCGAEFVLRLPALPRQPGEAQATAARRAGRASGVRVLVVEDNPDVAEGLTMLLEGKGHAVVMTHDGLAALEAARSQGPAVVLVDIGLPGMDGYEVARRLRALPETAGATLVALSGYGRDEDRARALAAGFDGHLVKPVDLDALDTLLAAAVGSAAALHVSAGA